ncbi:triglyceride lipase NDAI_0F00360 [Naumovozyma dairenensis CBS 421]|uniref:AB hydrolase-1 domain-containing protein n=1 Tax=Naumovozyma dairenensis (strain ATCC 10597 / BCRC 20456 / CBS 421 / NBRC 0211 / NRRL Y-12639) TaxID=1071378 RepID=G0WC44_NAUDC|nr:hypothetical protein NDAI_0F00360 [Naumovozyma dairenensis CBS 421]CCD25355.1 hypothetical protein NDAI_0F00360 [Naumovozyma dairenensis CBS 421]
MEQILNSSYYRETKIINAIKSRAQNATLNQGIDQLQIVYDLYTYININTNISSTNKINMIFLHGSGMNRSIWEYHISKMIDYLKTPTINWSINKIILMDQVTHGDSGLLNKEKLGVEFNWNDGAKDACLVAQTEFYPLTNNNNDQEMRYFNVVVGHSMGGFQALACGALYPYLFNLIITVEPVVVQRNPFNSNDMTIMPESFYNSLISKMDDCFDTELGYNEFMQKKSFYTKVHPIILKRLIEFEKIWSLRDGSEKLSTKMNKFQNILCYLTLNPGANWLIHNLQFIESPVINLTGENSKWTPPENEKLLRTKIKNYTLDPIPNGDHLVNIENPDETLRKIVFHISKFVTAESTREPTKPLSITQRQSKFERDFVKFKDKRTRKTISSKL